MALRCLIVDDSPRFVEAARGLLEREGIVVLAKPAWRGGLGLGDGAVALVGLIAVAVGVAYLMVRGGRAPDLGTPERLTVPDL